MNKMKIFVIFLYIVLIVHLTFSLTSFLMMDTNSTSKIARFFANDVVDSYEFIGFGIFLIGMIIATLFIGIIIIITRRLR